MQLANFINEIRQVPLGEGLGRLAHRSGFPAISAEIHAVHGGSQTCFWFATENLTAYLYGSVLRDARLALRGAPVKPWAPGPEDVVRGVLLHFACREANLGTHVLLAGALRPSDIACVAFPKNSADFVFCQHPVMRSAAPPPATPASGNLLLDATPNDLARLLSPGSIGTLFFDLTAELDADLRLLAVLAPLLAHDAVVIAQGPAGRLHGVFTRLTDAGAARMWAQCVVAQPDTGTAMSFAYFEVLNSARLPHPGPRAGTRATVTAARIDPPRRASAGPYTYVESKDTFSHATATIDVAPARTTPFRKPLFVHGAENAETIWMGQFGRTADQWLLLSDIACPRLHCMLFDNLRIIGTEACITEQDTTFTASQMPMLQERFVGWAGVYRSDMHLVQGGLASARACTIGQVLPAPTMILSNGGLPMHYHFLFDVLPRLYYLQHPTLSSYRIALPDTVSAYQLDALTRYYGIEPERIDIFATHGPACLFEHACVAPSMVSDFWAMPETIAAPRAALRHATPPKDPRFCNARRLYVSRRDVQDSRGLANETELVERLVAMGFIEIFPSRFDYAEEMYLFAHADVVVGPFGSGMANLMFCSPGARIVILQPDSTNWRILSFVMDELDVQYGYVFGEAFRRASRGHNTEWIIDVDAVAARVGPLL